MSGSSSGVSSRVNSGASSTHTSPAQSPRVGTEEEKKSKKVADETLKDVANVQKRLEQHKSKSEKQSKYTKSSDKDASEETKKPTQEKSKGAAYRTLFGLDKKKEDVSIGKVKEETSEEELSEKDVKVGSSKKSKTDKQNKTQQVVKVQLPQPKREPKNLDELSDRMEEVLPEVVGALAKGKGLKGLKPLLSLVFTQEFVQKILKNPDDTLQPALLKLFNAFQAAAEDLANDQDLKKEIKKMVKAAGTEDSGVPAEFATETSSEQILTVLMGIAEGLGASNAKTTMLESYTKLNSFLSKEDKDGSIRYKHGSYAKLSHAIVDVLPLLATAFVRIGTIESAQKEAKKGGEPFAKEDAITMMGSLVFKKPVVKAALKDLGNVFHPLLVPQIQKLLGEESESSSNESSDEELKTSKSKKASQKNVGLEGQEEAEQVDAASDVEEEKEASETEEVVKETKTSKSKKKKVASASEESSDSEKVQNKKKTDKTATKKEVKKVTIPSIKKSSDKNQKKKKK